jgi:succinate-semialdehyde dehydrogenase/glutarate-semialdehyde dehydrogenase
MNERDIIAGAPKQLYIAGAWRDASAAQTLTVEDPSTGQALCEVADAQPSDAVAALSGHGTRPASAVKSCAARSKS